MMRIEPYLQGDRIRFKVSDIDIEFEDHNMTLRVVKESKFDSILTQFAPVFSEHMKTQVQSDLLGKISLAV